MNDMIAEAATYVASVPKLIPLSQAVPVCLENELVEPPGRRLLAAVDILGRHLWNTMRQTSWWCDSSPLRCIWACSSAVAFLQKAGIQAEVVSAFLQVYAADTEMQLKLPVVLIGYPQNGLARTGLHTVVMVREGQRQWLLETSLWQAQRAHFSALPSMMLLDMPKESVESPLPEFAVGKFDGKLDAHIVRIDRHGKIGLGWRLMPQRRNWVSAPDAKPKRAKMVASRLAALLQAA